MTRSRPGASSGSGTGDGAWAGLAGDLRRAVRGAVAFDDGARALYATDASNYRQVPIGVVVPEDADDVAAAVEVCRRHDAPIVPRGAGTSLAGQCCNVAVVLDMSRHMNRILELDAAAGVARVEPGVVLDDLRAAAERHHLTFGPDPATHAHCTLGGMIGNNACGVHSIIAGRTSDNVEALDVLTYDGERLRVGATSDAELDVAVRAGGRRGEIYAGLRGIRDRHAGDIRARYPAIPRRVSGYNLDELLPERGFHVARALTGTEGTCALVLEATVRLVESPPGRALVVVGYPDVYAAADDSTEVLGYGPLGLEGFDEVLAEDQRRIGRTRAVSLLPEGRGWLLVEFGGHDDAEARAAARSFTSALARRAHPPSMRLLEDPQEALLVWRLRETALGATSHVPGRRLTWEGWEDAAVAPAVLGAYLREFRALVRRYGYHGALYGHFGDGCVHTRLDFDFTSAGGIARYRAFIGEAADLVLAYGGSLSGEHGDGQARAELLPKMFGDRLTGAFAEFKRLWDPAGRMNPGKVVDAYAMDDNLRLAVWPPAAPATRFRYPEDGGDMRNAALRCVGVGLCRKTAFGTMCPSYMATGEEKHSTRGRARLLWEMLHGEVIRDGWRSDAVKEALDLCLACKGCKADCPVGVDMATYKAEFLSHYYRGRVRPFPVWAMGMGWLWARLAVRMPAAANALTQSPAFSPWLKAAAGIAPERSLPRVAAEPFASWFARRAQRDARRPGRALAGGGRRVVLFADTFTNCFSPEIGRDAVAVLEASGFTVEVPRGPLLCCGRPLYDAGMLGLARALLERAVRRLAPVLRDGAPLVVLEPSCASVFRDELRGLLAGDARAERVARATVSLAEVLGRNVSDAGPAAPRVRALVQGHCHQSALAGMDHERTVLRSAGIDAEILDSGCCGMAGAFGLRAEHYDVSLRIGERVLFPAIRAAAADTLVVADGFSCRQQIREATGRDALHVAQALRRIHAEPAPPAGTG